ncbi:MAG: hypothetical protein V1729_03875 [Candidatus Woesearchaeota archaeon]
MKLKNSLKVAGRGLASAVLGAYIAISPGQMGTAEAANPTKTVRYTECVPKYLQEPDGTMMESPADPAERMLEKDRVYKSMKTKYPYGSSHNALNGSIEVTRKIHGASTIIIFPNYVRQEDDSVNHYHAAGMDRYSPQEFECIVQDQIQYMKHSASLAMKDYEKTLDKIITSQEKMLKEEGALKEDDKLADMLDDAVPGYPGLTIRDVMFTPETKIQDFIPTRYYFGEIPALGLCYINTGVVAIDPKARVLDHINGWPTIFVHEMTHRNPKFQSWPMLNKFDAELWASLPMLTREDFGHFMFHSYLNDVRKVAKVLWNFDSELANEDILRFNFAMGPEYDMAKLRENIDKTEKIAAMVQHVAFDHYIPAFYTHPFYFMTMNHFLKEDNATFKLMMYMHYEPTLLGGFEKTRDFLQENEEVFDKLAREVAWDLKSRGRDQGSDSFDAATREKIKGELERRLDDMTPQERQGLIGFAKSMGAPVNNPEELIDFGIRMYRLGIVNYDLEEEVLKR